MDIFTRLALVATLALQTACASPGPVVRDLGTRGVTERSTAKVVFIGATGEPGGRTRVTVVEPGVSRAIWTALRAAKPAEAQRLVNPRTLEIYDGIGSRIPAAAFLVEGDQITPADQPQTGAYSAPGLYDLMGLYLQGERDRLQRLNPVPVAPTTP